MMYAVSVKRLQILIDEDLDEALEWMARDEGTSKAALIRRFVRDRVTVRRSIQDDPIWGMIGAYTGASGPVDDVVYPRE